MCVLQRFLTQFVANQRYQEFHIKSFERELLQSLKWNLHPVTSHALTMVMLELHPNEAERAKIMQVASILLDMQLSIKEFLQYSTKAVALGCFGAACTIAGLTEAHEALLARISHLVDRKAVVRIRRNLACTRLFWILKPTCQMCVSFQAEADKLNVTLKQMYYANFPEPEPEPEPEEKRLPVEEKRSSSPASIMESITVTS